MQAGGWAVLSIVFGMLCSLRVSRQRMVSILVLVAAVVLLLPADILPLLRGVFYGAVAGAVVQLDSWATANRDQSLDIDFVVSW